MSSFGNFLRKAKKGIASTYKKVDVKVFGGALPGGQTIRQVGTLRKAKKGIASTYKKVDVKVFGGALPGGQTIKQVRTSNLKKRNTQQKALNEQKIDKQVIKNDYTKKSSNLNAERDLFKTNIFERVSGNVSPEEKTIQALQQKSAYYPNATELTVRAIPDYNIYTQQEPATQAILMNPLPEIPQQERQESGFVQATKSLTLPLLIVGAIVLIPKILNK